MLRILISPQYKLYLDGDESEKSQELKAAFAKSSGHGLLFLDQEEEYSIQEDFSYWKEFVRLYLAYFALVPELDKIDLKKTPVHLELSREDIEQFLLMTPVMKGAEYVNEDCLLFLWKEIEEALIEQIITFNKSIEEFFALNHPSWSLLGKVCFHLAENKKSEETPFAFLATYAHKVSKEGKTQHLALHHALEEYSEGSQKSTLIRLLAPIHKATLESSFLKKQVNSGAIFSTLAWTAQEAYLFLKDIPLFESAGIAVKVPNWWKRKQSLRPTIKVKLGEKEPSKLGFDALLDFSASIVIDEEILTEKEIEELLHKTESLVFFKGQWVELDRNKLENILAEWKSLSKNMKAEGVSFSEGLQLLAGLRTGSSSSGINSGGLGQIAHVVSGSWLKEKLEEIKSPEINKKMSLILKSELNASLRPYQMQGVAWLYTLNQLRLGGILADDMGLGKTIQVISFLLLKKQENKIQKNKTLLIVPASLLGNWKAEMMRFAPTLKFRIVHPSGDKNKEPTEDLFDVYMTTYAYIAKVHWLNSKKWDLIILDEAQAIKNPSAKQTKLICSMQSDHKIALTGTPVENHVSDLWSLFSFVSPRLLGSKSDLERFLQVKKNQIESPYAALRTLVKPYILRRLKTDKSVINDLPDKTELKSYCTLSKEQIFLYQQSVEDMKIELEKAEGIKRRGTILSFIMRFKQICNHPSQFMKDGQYGFKESGKYLRLKEICDVISEKQEKVLVFTQFKEMTEPISECLKNIFGRSGLVLHGDISVNKRMEMVNLFQNDENIPYFVLSLKAGGTGLNLTRASHVIHFDRWWNPAVENQATDRAFRIGQKKNVLVHKFICKGTFEEKIDLILESKKTISKEILEEGSSVFLTELTNDELIKVISLDMNSAQVEL